MRHFKPTPDTRFMEEMAAYVRAHLARTEDAVPQDVCAAEEPCCAPSPALREKPSATRGLRAGKPVAGGVPIVLAPKQPTFQQHLFRLIDSRGVKDSAVYKRADIDRRHFAKIRADENYHPSKSTAIRFCLALELDIEAAQQLLESAGYCLSYSDTADLVVRYCIEHGRYDLVEVNLALDYFDCEAL